jgi:hypothetical protein
MPSSLCQYSEIFGRPGEGAHAPRVAGLAAVDVAGTVGIAYLAARYGLGAGDPATVLAVFVVLMLCTVYIHEAFCVNTRLNAAIFGRPWPSPHPRAPVKNST